MSEFHVEVVRLGKIARHPKADTLEITTVRGGYTVIFKENQYKEGDLVVFVPEDALVPLTDERWSYLRPSDWSEQSEDDRRKFARIKAMRLRGIFSMGVITNSESCWSVGQNVQNELNILKWEPEIPATNGECERDPGFLPVYTDIESLRRWPNILRIDEEVILTEKIHGANGRWLFNNERLWVGSHNNIKKDGPNLWWNIAKKFDLENKLRKVPGIAIYGEVFGQVQKGFDYNIPDGRSSIALFDAMEIKHRRYLDYDEFLDIAKFLELPTAPILYRGLWNDELKKMSDGKTVIGNGKHIREGFVVRPIKERWTDEIGRVILKLVGEEYLIKKHK